MPVIKRLVAAVAVFVAAHFAMGFINSSAGGPGGNLLFPTRPMRRRGGSSAAWTACWDSSSR